MWKWTNKQQETFHFVLFLCWGNQFINENSIWEEKSAKYFEAISPFTISFTEISMKYQFDAEVCIIYKDKFQSIIFEWH